MNIKKLFLILFFSAFGFAVDPAIHGMVIFGERDKIYASHMPQFKAPFNYQAIFEIELEEDVKKAYLDALDQLLPKQSITMVTEEQIVLADLEKNPKTIRASLYQGNFNKPGSAPLELNTEVKIKETLYFKELDANNPKSKEVEYLYFGVNDPYVGLNDIQHFFVHKITGPGDFDQILRGVILPASNFSEKYRTVVLAGEKDAIDFGSKSYKVYDASDINKNENRTWMIREYLLDTESLKK